MKADVVYQNALMKTHEKWPNALTWDDSFLEDFNAQILYFIYIIHEKVKNQKIKRYAW